MLRKAVLEAFIFVDIYEMLKGITLNAELVGKLKLATRIPDLDKEKSNSASGRNHLFELHLASFLAKSGIKINGFDDIQFEFDGFNFHIECKRPSSVRKMGKRIVDAYGKLKSTYVNTKSRGIIAISADKVIFPHEYLQYEEGDPKATLETFELSTADESIRMKCVEKMTRVFIEKYGDKWHWIPDPRLIGIMVVYRFMINDRKNDQLLSAFVPALVPCCSPATLQGSDMDLLERLAAFMEKNNPKRLGIY